MAISITWDATFQAAPLGDESIANGDNRIVAFKDAVQERITREHVWGVSETQANHGWHREGSAMAYVDAAEPANKPDGATALSSIDEGRLWVDSDNDNLAYYDGSSWTSMAGYQEGSNLALYDQATDQDRNIEFASDADILWDESEDEFNINKAINVTAGVSNFAGIKNIGTIASADNIFFDDSSPLRSGVWAKLNALIPSTGNYMRLTGSINDTDQVYVVHSAYRASSTVIYLQGVNMSVTSDDIVGSHPGSLTSSTGVIQITNAAVSIGDSAFLVW